MPFEKKEAESGTPTQRNAGATLCRALFFSGLVIAVSSFFVIETPPEFRRWFASLVRRCDGVVRSGIRSLQEEPDFFKILHFGLFSLLYGFLHSAGPGHGKALVGAYFLRRRHSAGKVFLLAGVIAFVHTLGAVVLSFVFATLLKEFGLFFRVGLQGYLIAASGALIAVIGLAMLFYKLSGREGTRRGTLLFENPFLLGMAAGIVPCPASMMLVLFSISHGIVPYGLFSVFAMSLGMFLLLSMVGLLVVKGREGTLRLVGGGGGMERIGTALEYCSLLLIVFIGGLMTASILA